MPGPGERTRTVRLRTACEPCKPRDVGRQTRDQAPELRAVAPLVVSGAQQTLVGPCTLVSNGTKTVGFSSAELLRNAGESLAVAVSTDGSKTLPVTSWMMGRAAGIGVLELGGSVPRDSDVQPLTIASVCATVETRGAPAALVTVERGERGFSRRIIPVHVDLIDGGGMSDVITRLASPTEAADATANIDGSALFAWLPPDPVLGRDSEILVVALGCTYRQKTFKPRELPALAELVGLDDLGRALPWNGGAPEGSNELRQVAGEIKDDDKT